MTKSRRSSLLYSNVEALCVVVVHVANQLCPFFLGLVVVEGDYSAPSWEELEECRKCKTSTQVRAFLFEVAPIWGLGKGPLWHDLVAAAKKIWLLRQLRDLLNPELTMLHPWMWSCFLALWPGNASLLTDIEGQDREIWDLFWWIWRDAWNTELVESWQTNRVWSNKSNMSLTVIAASVWLTNAWQWLGLCTRVTWLHSYPLIIHAGAENKFQFDDFLIVSVVCIKL